MNDKLDLKVKINRDKPEVTWTIEMFSQIKMITIWDLEDFIDTTPYIDN